MAEPSKKPVIAIVVAALSGLALFYVVWSWLSPPDNATPVAYSDFLAEVKAGNVERIDIKGRDYRFLSRGPDGGFTFTRKTTVGPVADQSLLDSLKPADSANSPPAIHIEK